MSQNLCIAATRDICPIFFYFFFFTLIEINLHAPNKPKGDDAQDGATNTARLLHKTHELKNMNRAPDVQSALTSF